MSQKIRLITWVIIVILSLISFSFLAFQIGKQQGIEQAYHEFATQKITLPEASENIPQ